MSQPTIWITGASSGIGRVFARHYASQGCRLILTARRGDQLEKLAALLGCPCRILPADLSDPAQWDTLCAALETERIDGFINNAGFGLCGAFTETDPAVEQEMLQVNVGALQRLMKFVLGKMQAQGSGFILNVASCAGLMPGGPYMAVYYATKAYVVSLTRAVAQELREQHSPVKVFALCPGPGGHRVQPPGQCGVCAAGHLCRALRGRGPAGDAPGAADHCAVRRRAAVVYRPEMGPHAGADAHHCTAAEKEAAPRLTA